MDTRYLRSFVKIAEIGSISRAAVSLAISQPSLSQQMVRLEEEFGAALLRRTARGVQLTEGGRILLDHARHILAISDQAIEHVRELTEPSGAVTLAVPYSISRLAGVALIEAFARNIPRVSVRLVEASTGQIRGWLDNAKIDLGILNGAGRFQNLAARPIASEELFLVGPAGAYPTGTGETPSIPVDALPPLPMILPGSQHGLRQTIEDVVARLGLGITVRLELDALVHVPDLIARGHGYSILPLSALTGEPLGDRVSVARIGSGVFRRSLSLVRNGAQFVTHASVRCEDLVAEVLAGLIADGAWRAEPGDDLARLVGHVEIQRSRAGGD